MKCNTCGLPCKPKRFVSSLEFSTERVYRGQNGTRRDKKLSVPNVGIFTGHTIDEEHNGHDLETQSTKSHLRGHSPPPSHFHVPGGTLGKHLSIHNSLPNINQQPEYNHDDAVNIAPTATEDVSGSTKSRPKLLQENAALRADKESLKKRMEAIDFQLREARENSRASFEETNRLSALIESKYKPLEREFLAFRDDVKNQMISLKNEKQLQFNHDASKIHDLQRELNSTKQRLDFLSKEKMDLEASKSESDRKIHDLEDEAKRLERDLKQSERDGKKVKEERDSVMEKLRHETLSFNDEIARMKKLIDEQEMRSKKEILNTKSAHSVELKRCQSQLNEEFNQILRNKDDSITKLKLEVRTLQEQNESLKREESKNQFKDEKLKKLQFEAETYEQSLSELKEKLNRTEITLQDEIRKLHKLNSDLVHGSELEKERVENRNAQKVADITNGFKQRERELQEEVAKVKEQYSKETEVVIKDFQRKFTDKESECNALMRNLQRLENDISKEQQISNTKVEKVESEKDFWKKKFENEQNGLNDRMSDFRQSKEREISDLKTQIKYLEQQKGDKIRSLKDELEKLKKSSETQIQKMTDQLRENSFTFAQEKNALNQRLEKSVDDLNRAKEQLINAENRFEKEDNRLQTVIKDIKQSHQSEIQDVKNNFIREKSELLQKLQSAEEKLLSHFKNIEDIRQENEKSNASIFTENKKLKSELENLRQQNSALEEQERSVRFGADDAKRLADQSERKVNDLENQLSNQKRAIKSLEDDNSNLVQLLEKQRAESKKEVKERTLKFEEEKSNLEQLLETLENNIEALKREKNRLENDLKTKMVPKNEEIRRLRDEIETLRIEFEQREAELDSKRAESRTVNERLNSQLRQAEQANDKLLSDIRNSRQEKSKLNEEKNFLESQLKKSEEEKTDLETEAKIAMETLESTFKDKLTLLQEDMANLKFEMENRDTSINDMVSENERLKSQNSELEETLRVTMMIMKMMKGAIDT